MKLTTAKTKQYALLVVKLSTGGVTATERKQYDALVTEMAKPEPRKKTKKKSATKAADITPKKTVKPKSA